MRNRSSGPVMRWAARRPSSRPWHPDAGRPKVSTGCSVDSIWPTAGPIRDLMKPNSRSTPPGDRQTNAYSPVGADSRGRVISRKWKRYCRWKPQDRKPVAATVAGRLSASTAPAGSACRAKWNVPMMPSGWRSLICFGSGRPRKASNLTLNKRRK